jgi:hypothetical protein
VSNYVKSTNFTSKDTLPLGDPLKIVKGTEIDVELNNIAAAVATKADLTSPAFIGTPTAPTASLGTNTNQLATTAFVIAAIYPVGSVYINATNSANPSTYLGFGTWTAFGAGRVPVGFDSSDTNFNAAEKTGGSKDAIVVDHTHTGSTNTTGAHTHQLQRHSEVSNIMKGTVGDNGFFDQGLFDAGMTAAGDHSHTFTTNSTGSSGTNANLQPYITVFMWKRVS